MVDHAPDAEPYADRMGGRAALEALLGRSAEELGRMACEQLAKVFQLDAAYLREQLLGCSTHHWSADEQRWVRTATSGRAGWMHPSE